ASVPIQPAEHRLDTAAGQGDAGVGGTVVKIDAVAIRLERIAARKNHIAHVPVPLVVLLGPEDPMVTPEEADLRVFQVEKRQPEPVDGARGGLPNAVIDHQPAGGRLNRRRGQPDSPRVPPAASPSLKDQSVSPPVPE